jgi:hypothetical protein
MPDAGDPARCVAPDGGGVGDCVTYTPAMVAGSRSGRFTRIDEAERVAVSVPDRGGGLVRVTLQASAATSVTVFLQGRPEDENHEGVLLTNEPEKSFLFRAHGNKTYELEVKAFITPPAGGSSWAVSWTYEPNVDCYEPNDTAATARRIPLDTPITAFAHAGIIEGDGVLVGPGLLDYYAFELTEPTTVRLAVTRPSDTAIAFELFDLTTETSTLVSSDLFAAAGVQSFSDELELPAGVHGVRVSSFASQRSTLGLPATPPADWNRPYTFSVQRTKVRSAGSGTLVCAAPVDAGVFDDECVRYQPATIAGMATTSMSLIDQKTVVRVPSISDPGGGLLRVTLSSLVPHSVVARRVGAPDAEVQEGVGPLMPTAGMAATESFLLRVQGGETYELEVALFVTPAQAPATSTVSWSYEPNVDCYEANDSRAKARRIPLGRAITAFAHGGPIAGDSLFVGPSIADWYRVQVPSAREVRLVVRKPSDTALAFELLDQRLEVLEGVDALGSGGVDLSSPWRALEPGEYLVRMTTAGSQPSSKRTTDALPADWNRPYTLTVEAR